MFIQMATIVYSCCALYDSGDGHEADTEAICGYCEAAPYYGPLSGLRGASRSRGNPDSTNNHVGMRCARD